MEVSCQLHAQAALHRGRLPVAIGWETAWAPEPVWTRWEDKKVPSLTLPKIRPFVV